MTIIQTINTISSVKGTSDASSKLLISYRIKTTLSIAPALIVQLSSMSSLDNKPQNENEHKNDSGKLKTTIVDKATIHTSDVLHRFDILKIVMNTKTKKKWKTGLRCEWRNSTSIRCIMYKYWRWRLSNT